MNRWILRGLATAGCAAGWWLLTTAPAYADAPATTTAHHAESGPPLGLRLDLDAGARPLLRTHADTTDRTGARAISAHATGFVDDTHASDPAGRIMTNKTDRRTTARTTARVARNRTHQDTSASARVSAAITGGRTRTSGGASTTHPNPDPKDRRTITDTTGPTATACLSALTLDDCATRGTSPAPATATTRRSVAGTRTAVSLDKDGLDVCLNAGVLHATTVCSAEPAARPSTGNSVLDLCLTATLLGDTVGCGAASDDQPVADGMAGAEAGVGPAGNDDENYDVGQGGQDVSAAYGDALTDEITEMQRTAELPLTGSALAGFASALIAAGFLLIVSSRRRRTA